jgi:hypothetical protein
LRTLGDAVVVNWLSHASEAIERLGMDR